MYGSSPHARGLLSETLTASLSGRIIPARAGFTLRDAVSVSERPDHPRTRGVYEMSNRSGVVKGGIIPARAGFTSCRILMMVRMADHPRTRGVYSPLTQVKSFV